VAIIATIATGLVAFAGGPSETPGPTGSAAPTRPAPTGTPVLLPPPAGITYRDFKYETPVVTIPSPGRAQSRLWFAAGVWWAGLYQPASNHLNIFRLDWETQRWMDTGTLVDERPFADPDFLWTGEYLYVVSAGHNDSDRHAGRLLRFTMDEDGLGYRIDPNFPVTIIPAGTTAATIAIDSAARLWVAFAAGGKIWVAHSLEHDAHWSAPFELPVIGTTVEITDIASIVAFGPGRVGVMWSNQLTNSIYFSVHLDSDAPDKWSETEVVLDGVGASQDRIDLKAYPTADGEIGVAAAVGDLPGGRLAPLILLVIRSDLDGWQSSLVSQVRDKQSHAVLMIDSTARTFLVAATTPEIGGAMVYKRASMDDVIFEAGDGDPLLSSPGDLRIDHGSSTKQPLTEESGLVILASDDDTGRYLHGIIDLGAGEPPADPADPTRSAVPDPPDPARPIPLVANDFEPWTVGDAGGTAWLPRPTDPNDAVSIVDDGDGGRALRIVPGPDANGVRVCRELPPVGTGTLTAELRVRVAGLGTSDTSILSLRGSGGEAASLRVTERGEFAWFDKTTKVRTTAIFRTGRWYRVTVSVDQAARTYAFTISSDGGDPLVERTKVGWRHAAVKAVREICLETATGNDDQTIDLAEVQVLQELGS
jgi:hypothetical protein